MATTTTPARGIQHFSVTAGNDIAFGRPITSLIFTASASTVTISFDGGVNFMTLTATTQQFINIYIETLHVSGTGTITGVGFSL